MNRFWRLDRHPVGNDAFVESLSLCSEEIAPLAEGEVRIAAQWLSMDAGTRMWMSPRTDGYQPPLPLGSKMTGLVLGRVSESRDPAFPVGTMVRGFGQWAEQSVVTPALAALEAVDDSIADPRQHFGALGLNASTAYAGVAEVLGVRAGEWLAVSAAAGATGSLACQIGRNLGARVIGIAGGPAKCAYLREALGAEIAIDYRSQDVAAELARVPGGVHAFFDNVGGAILDAVLPNMAHYGRIAICGLISAYASDMPMAGPRHFDQILMRRLRVEGFFIPDFLDRASSFLSRLRAWHDGGTLALHIDETVGIENVLTAYRRMLTGGSLGKVVVRL
ncbi:NADP-dependent oxidoreductase [Sphingomonas populi]|uniref:NADP-dependent oxidoreductase n=1 Tax=Sphingomonas populi TaxID=2484750 RepID=A0A4Q6Y1X1_9SPHN|nr:NADP-dependent oxidoreductase [Sphingomonas populi]RZF63227.1 NADP-dependent oxidoreductase [Sphingomonas populi]